MSRSTFPQTIDTFTEHRELTPEEVAAAKRWKALRAQANKTAAEIVEFNTLTEQLSDAFLSSEDINKVQDCMVALETFFKENVIDWLDNYLDSFKYKGEWESIVSYKQFNTVTLNGSSYIALVDNLNKKPGTEAGVDYWGLLAQKGDKTIVETRNNTVIVEEEIGRIDLGVDFDSSDTLYVFKDGMLLVAGKDYFLNTVSTSVNYIRPYSDPLFSIGTYHFEIIASVPSDFQTQLDNKGTVFRVWG